jgi:hypothetical protein
MMDKQARLRIAKLENHVHCLVCGQILTDESEIRSGVYHFCPSCLKGITNAAMDHFAIVKERNQP